MAMNYLREFLAMVAEEQETKILRSLPRFALVGSYRWEYRLIHNAPGEEF